jgi:hypothetical protein
MRNCILGDAEGHFSGRGIRLFWVSAMRNRNFHGTRSYFCDFSVAPRDFFAFCFFHRLLAAFLRCSTRLKFRHSAMAALSQLKSSSSIPSRLYFSIVLSAIFFRPSSVMLSSPGPARLPSSAYCLSFAHQNLLKICSRSPCNLPPIARRRKILNLRGNVTGLGITK